MPILATRTIAAINEALEKDQGAKFRQLLKERMPESPDAYSGENEAFRTHLGASLIGKDCPRELWYNFHWVKKPHFDGKTIRLFNRGHLEEPRMVALLQMIGCIVHQIDHNGEQFRISEHGGHFGSAIDGVVENCPDVPNIPILAEFKTHGDKSYKELEKVGMREAKFEHYVQMQIYMGKYGLRAGLYMAVNKNDDQIYAEIVEFDSATYSQYVERAGRIIFSLNPPTKLNESPGFYKCKYCSYNKICHQGEMPERNCRTCLHSVVLEQGGWHCMMHSRNINKEEQKNGCLSYKVRET